MRDIRYLAVGVLAMTLAAPAYAEEISIESAVAAALSHVPELDVARANVAAAKASYAAARAEGGVQAGLSGSVGFSETDYTTATASLTPWQAGVQADWAFYTSGAQSANKDQAARNLSAADYSARATRNQVAFDTLSAYAQLLVAERTLGVNDQKVETLQLRRKETEARFDQGLVTQTDVALSQARLAGAEAEREASRAGLAASRALLTRLTGISAPETDGVLKAVELSPTASLGEAILKASEMNPSVEAAREAALAASAGVRRAQAQFGPSLSLSAQASASKETFFFFSDEVQQAGAFLNFQVPLFTNGLKSATRRQAVAMRSQADARVRMANLGVVEAVSAVWGDIAARKLAVEAAERQETATAKVAEGARREYEAGLRSLVDALDAEDERRQAEIFKTQAQATLFLSKARLVLLTGGDLTFNSGIREQG